MFEELIQLDKDLFLFLNGLGNPNWDGFWMFATNKLSSIPLYFILLVLAYKQLGLRKTLVVLLAIQPGMRPAPARESTRNGQSLESSCFTLR